VIHTLIQPGVTVKTLTLRGLSPILKRAIQDRAAQKRISLTKAAIELLEEAAGVRKTVGKREPYDDLDDLAGTWTREEAATFETALHEQRGIDEDLWK
jgi:hypothetical protein